MQVLVNVLNFEMERYGYIYLITNRSNKKQYVGQTVRDPIKRWIAHKKSKGKTLASADIQNFSFEVIWIAFDQEALNDAEIRLIIEFDTLSPQGYNLRAGGNSGGHFSAIVKENFHRVRSTPEYGRSNFNNPVAGRSTRNTRWITNGISNRRIPQTSRPVRGWWDGRTMP